MNLYVAGAALGVTTSAAVAAVWILGPGGTVSGVGSQSAVPGHVYDMQVSPYLARVDYQGGSSALVPISIAFRVTDKQAGRTPGQLRPLGADVARRLPQPHFSDVSGHLRA